MERKTLTSATRVVESRIVRVEARNAITRPAASGEEALPSELDIPRAGDDESADDVCARRGEDDRVADRVRERVTDRVRERVVGDRDGERLVDVCIEGMEGALDDKDKDEDRGYHSIPFLVTTARASR